MKEQDRSFENIKAQLQLEGYRAKDVTFTSGKATALGVLYALPFLAVLGAIYEVLLKERAVLSETGILGVYGAFLAITIVSVVIHELLHALGWAAASGQGWQVVRLNWSMLMPSCACKIALDKKSYLVGVLAPLVVLGTVSTIFLWIRPGTLSLLTMLVNFTAAGADVLIASKVLKEGSLLIIDHPTEAGYVAFYRP